MTTLPLADGRDRPREPPSPARRPLRARLSSGHLVVVLAGLVAMLLNYHVLRSGDDGTPVAVLAGDVAAGQPVGGEHVRLVEVAAGADLLATLVSGDDLAVLDGRVARADLPAGSLLRHADLQAVAAPGGLRAMSVPVDPEHAAGGSVEAGDRVDVIEVRDGRAEYLLADAAVLAVTSPDVRAGIAASRAYSVTLAVDDEQALRLALAIRESSLALLRSTGAPPPRVRHAEHARPGAGPATAGGGVSP